MTTRVITYTYECAASLERSEKDPLYRLAGADHRSIGLTAGSTGEGFEYAYDAVGNPVSAALRDLPLHRLCPDLHLDHSHHLVLSRRHFTRQGRRLPGQYTRHKKRMTQPERYAILK